MSLVTPRPRTRIVMIADDPDRLAPFRERYGGKNPQFQLVTTTNISEGLMLAGAMPADALVVVLDLLAANRMTVLAAFKGRTGGIPLHWVANDETRTFLESESASEIEIDSLLEDSLPPEEIFSFFVPDAAEEASLAPRRARLQLEEAVERPPAPTPEPEPEPQAEAAPARARLDPAAGSFDLSVLPLVELVDRLAAKRGNGSLAIEHNGQVAGLHFAGGKPVHATFGGLGGMGALVNFAHWQDGLARWTEEAEANFEHSLDPVMVVGMLRSIPNRKLEPE